MKAALVLALACIAPFASAQASPSKAFDQLKALVGKWEGTEGGKKYQIEYRLTGHGSALFETQFPGEPHEMVTVYHMNGDKLELTHYCAAMNQPHMRMAPGKDLKTVKFDFVSGSNMKPTDVHIHSVVYHFLDKDHIVSEWIGYVKGKPGGTEKFDLHRVKA